MPPIQDQHHHHPHPHDLSDPVEELDELVEQTLTPPPLDRSAVICGVLGLMVVMTMLLIAVGVIPLYDWRAQ